MKLKIISTIGLVFILLGCKKERELIPNPVEINLFAVPEDANDPESLLRRQFFTDEDTYLLFNDTLRKEYQGKDAYGDDTWFVERVNIDYAINNTGDWGRVTPLIGILQKQQAIDFVKVNILSHLGPKLRPYSLLLTDNYAIYDSYRKTWKKYNIKSGIRCVALSLADVLQQNSIQQQVYINEVLFEILNSALSKQQDDVLADFYAFSAQYHSLDKAEDLGWPYVLNDAKVREIGFLKDVSRYYLPSKKQDLDAFLQQVLTTKRADFVLSYGAYPLLLAKYDKLNEILTKLGFIQ